MIYYTIFLGLCAVMSAVGWMLSAWNSDRLNKRALAAKDTEIASVESRADLWRVKWRRDFCRSAELHSDQLDELELKISALKDEVERRHEQSDSWQDCAIDWSDSYQESTEMWLESYGELCNEIAALKKAASLRKKGARTGTARRGAKKA